MGKQEPQSAEGEPNAATDKPEALVVATEGRQTGKEHVRACGRRKKRVRGGTVEVLGGTRGAGGRARR